MLEGELQSVPDIEGIVDRNGNVEKWEFKNDKLGPRKVLQEAINMFSSQIPVQVLEEDEGNAPKWVKEEFFSLLSFEHYLVLLDEIEHGHKCSSMHPNRKYFHNYCVLLVRIYDSFGEEDTQTPKTYHNDCL